MAAAALEVIRPQGGDPAPAPNPPFVEALVTEALVDEGAFDITIDGIAGDLDAEADGIDNDGDELVDEPGERLVTWPSGSMSRLIARWPWSLTEDDPATAANEGLHLLNITVTLPGGEVVEQRVAFAVFSTGGLDSLMVCPSPFDPFHQGARIIYRTKVSGSVRIRIHDFQGRVVTTLRDWSVTDPGGHYRGDTWNGRDREGRPVPNGVYYVRVEFDDGCARNDVVESCLVTH